MARAFDWREDAMVRLEKRLYPLGMRLLRRHLRGRGVDSELAGDLRATAAVLRDGQGHYFDAYGIKLGAAPLAALVRLAKSLDALALQADAGEPPFPDDPPGAAFSAELEGFLDEMRAAFLGEVLARQADAQRQAETAARQVTAISRQITFIAISASVEAARAGSAGKGFAVISGQIRALAEEASEALRRMGSSDAR